jgi:hypothetical protein
MSETVTAKMAADQVGPTTFQYTISLTNTSATSPVGTFWFAWDDVPDTNFLISEPISSSITSPSGWTEQITHNSPTDGYGIQWIAGTGFALQPGHTFTYSFETPDAPSQLFRLNTVEPSAGFDITSSFVYAGGPETDPGFNFTVPCFAAGTRLLTTAGEVAVEHLSVGDLVPTRLGGRLVPVRWIGRRTIDCRRHRRPREVWPVRVREGAFGPGRPGRDLLLSPDHAVHVDAVLIPVRYLVNGATIVQETIDRVEYWHVELPAHEVLLAEGLPVESYLDTGNRSAFANGDGPVSVHPDFALRVWTEAACAPLVVSGPALAAVKRVLLLRADALGHRRTTDPVLHLVADGSVLLPQFDGTEYRFALPAGVCRVRLRSLSAVPAEHYADSTDYRRLGIAVTQLAVDGTALSLDDAACADGWHAAEAGEGTAPRWQWTDGDAAIICPNARRLEVTILPVLRYWVAGTPATAAARR